MFLDKLDPEHHDDALATAMLRANMRVGLSGLAGGVFGTVAGLIGMPLPTTAKVIGLGVAVALGLSVGALLVFIARTAPTPLVANFARRIAAKRAEPNKLVVVSGRGAMVLGALAFVTAFAVMSYSALAP